MGLELSSLIYLGKKKPGNSGILKYYSFSDCASDLGIGSGLEAPAGVALLERDTDSAEGIFVPHLCVSVLCDACACSSGHSDVHRPTCTVTGSRADQPKVTTGSTATSTSRPRGTCTFKVFNFVQIFDQMYDEHPKKHS